MVRHALAVQLQLGLYYWEYCGKYCGEIKVIYLNYLLWTENIPSGVKVLQLIFLLLNIFLDAKQPRVLFTLTAAKKKKMNMHFVYIKKIKYIWNFLHWKKQAYDILFFNYRTQLYHFTTFCFKQSQQPNYFALNEDLWSD